jgi:uncharacterized membrane protein YgdD (TMEM256/DUF423 family)
MERMFLTLGSLSGLIAVAAGAFGAHTLRDRISAAQLTTFETGARYQMYHALALLVAAWATTRWPGPLTTAAGWFFVAGTLIFSGSLYALSLSGLRWLGAITPLGGIAFIGGWLCLALAAWRG